MSPTQMPKVDLVIVIDTSGSMRDEAVALSEAAEAVLQETELQCPADLRAVWLGIEGVWHGTNFDRTVRDYLTTECKANESDLLGRKRDTLPAAGAQEDGARAVVDVAANFKWRTNTKRAIFYLSDESLEGGGETVQEDDVEAASLAITTAKRRRINVHTYLGTATSSTRPESRERMKEEFARVAGETGGVAFTSDDGAIGFGAMLQDIVCVTQDKPPVPRDPVHPVADPETPSTTGSPFQEWVVFKPRKKRLIKRIRTREVGDGSRVILVKVKRKKKNGKWRRCYCPCHAVSRGLRKAKPKRYGLGLGKWGW